jgi:hypothetical protein
MKLSLALPLGVALACSLGCGGKSDSEKFADSYCAEIAKCCSKAGLPGDGNTCRQWWMFASAGGSYDAAAASACLADVNTQVGAGTFCTDLASTPACDSVYKNAGGGKKPGETCIFDSDCAPSNLGDVACAGVDVGSSSIDKCQVQMAGKAGDSPCVGTKEGSLVMYYSPSNATDVAPQGYVCNTADGVTCQNATCVALSSVGTTCMISTDCVRTAYCNYPQDVCAPKIGVGGICTGIAGSECVDNCYCDLGTKMCTTKLANGASCSNSVTCQSDYCSNGACQGSGNFGLSLLCGS